MDETKDFVLAAFYETLRNGVKAQLNKFRADIEHCLRGLIEAEVADETVTNICVGITCRMCTEIVYNWVFNYINVNGEWKRFVGREEKTRGF